MKSFSVGRSQLYIHKGARIPLCHVFVCIGEQDVLGEYMFTCVFVCIWEQDVLGGIYVYMCVCV